MEQEIIVIDNQYDFKVKKCKDGSYNIISEELYRKKYFYSDIGLGLYMDLRKNLMQQTFKKNFKILDFENSNEDDYNTLSYKIKINAENEQEARKIVTDKLKMIECIIDDAISSIKPFIENEIKDKI